MWSPLLQNDWVQFWNQTINFEDIYLLDIIVSIGAVWSSTDSQVKCGVQEIISTSREDLNYNQNRCSVNTTQIYHFSYIYIVPIEKNITAQRNVQNIFGARQNWKDLRFFFMFPSYQKELKIVKMKIFCMFPLSKRRKNHQKKWRIFICYPLSKKLKIMKKKRIFICYPLSKKLKNL